MWNRRILKELLFGVVFGLVFVNGERYLTIITDFLWTELDDMDVDEMWFQHAALPITKFWKRNILRNSNVKPRSCDFASLVFFI